MHGLGIRAELSCPFHDRRKPSFENSFQCGRSRQGDGQARNRFGINHGDTATVWMKNLGYPARVQFMVGAEHLPHFITIRPNLHNFQLQPNDLNNRSNPNP